MEKEKIDKFLEFYKPLEGYEKGEGQTFLNRLFNLFGYEDCHDAGGKFEKRTKVDKQTKFEDLLVPNKVIIEMKSRGKELNSHILQAREYWNHSYGENKTKYVILCNFDEFWVFDWNRQDAPLDKFKTVDIETRWRCLAFLSKERIEPLFENNVEKVTEEAVSKLLRIYHSLIKRGEPKEKVQRFTLQILICLFSEDIGLFPHDGFFLELILDCKNNKTSTYDLFTALFNQMNSKDKAKGGRFKDVSYFNGGVFKEIVSIELNENELYLLEVSAKFDWSKVEPAIFGNIFEDSMDKPERHQTGSHYTYEQDIMKIVRPTVIQPILEKIKKADTLDKLLELRKSLGLLKILDPACGSGNFLYITVRELKNLELEILSKIQELYPRYPIEDKTSVIQLNQFYGMDINNFAVELAKVTLSFGKKIFNNLFLEYIKSNHLSFDFVDKTLPFDDLDKNIIVTDALFTDWVESDFIIGNPPFLGGKYLREQRGDEYAERIYSQFPESKGQPDYCVFWFQKAHNSKAKRIGLVGTNSIAQGVSRTASLQYIVDNGGKIINAISTQDWSGEAHVHVSIVNWVKNKEDYPLSVYLDNKKVKTINSSLKNEADYTKAHRLKENLKLSFQGCELAGKGFVISASTAKSWIKEDSKNQDVLKVMIDGKTLVSPYMQKDWVIDFNDMSLEEASKYALPFEHVKKLIKPDRDKNARNARKVYWWQFGEKRPGMRKALEGLTCYFVLPKVAKYTCFQAIDISILPCEANMVIAYDDFFVLGILNSTIHLDWVHVHMSTLKADPRYTNTTCFETFPFPKKVSDAKKDSVREVMKELEDFRRKECLDRKCSITDFYNKFKEEPSSNLFKLHQKLDKSVCSAYGWKYTEGEKYNDELLELNESIHNEEEIK